MFTPQEKAFLGQVLLKLNFTTGSSAQMILAESIIKKLAIKPVEEPKEDEKSADTSTKKNA